MGGKNIVSSFSYNMRDMGIVEQAEKIAKADGISFSEFVVALLKEEVHRKKVVGQENEPNPLALPRNEILVADSTYNTAANKPFQSDLTHWFEVVDQTDSHAILGMCKGQALEIVRRADRRSMELRKNGIHR